MPSTGTYTVFVNPGAEAVGGVTLTSYEDAVYEHTSSPTRYFKARIAIDGNEWRMELKDGSRMWFRDGFLAARPMQAAMTRIRDRHGNTIVLTRNTDALTPLNVRAF